jgi:hypothetical protein
LQVPLTTGSGAAPKVRGVAVSGGTVWVVTDQETIGLDTTTLAVQHRFPVPPELGPLRSAAVANGWLWSIGANGSALVRVGLERGDTRALIPLLPSEPTQFRLPASLVAGGDTVWAMVQRRADPNQHGVRIAGWNTRTGKPTTAIELPSSADIGAIAVS